MSMSLHFPPPLSSEPTGLITEGQETEEFWSTVSGKGPHPYLDAAKVPVLACITAQHSYYLCLVNSVLNCVYIQ